VDQATKDALLDRFRSYLEGLGDDAEEPAHLDGETADLHSVFVEIAALRNEARAQSRLTKEAFDQFRGVFDTLRANGAALERELGEAKAREKEQSRALLRSLLLDIVDIRDRLAAAVESPPSAAPRSRRLPPPTPDAEDQMHRLGEKRAKTPGKLSAWLRRWLPPETEEDDPWREGLAMTLRRLDQVLAARRVLPIALVGKPFQPALARAVSVVEDETAADGVVTVVLRMGFTFEEEVLRPAEVTVAKRPPIAGRSDQGEYR